MTITSFLQLCCFVFCFSVKSLLCIPAGTFFSSISGVVILCLTFEVPCLDLAGLDVQRLLGSDLWALGPV